MRVTCQAILFDMDGVLIDSTQCVEESWRRFAKRHDLDEERVLAICHGRPAHLTIGEVAPHLHAVELGREICREQADDSGNVVIVPGAKKLLTSLPTGRWAVNTSAMAHLARKRLHDFSLPKPAILVTADDIEKGKPAPDGYLRAARELGYEPHNCVVIEDSPVGLQAAKAAGMRAIAVMTTFDREQLPEEPIAFVQDLREIVVIAAEPGRELELELGRPLSD